MFAMLMRDEPTVLMVLVEVGAVDAATEAGTAASGAKCTLFPGLCGGL